MKKIFIALLSVVCVNVSAQQTPSVEEYLSAYYILVSDTTMMPLPKEKGKIGKHQNKVKKWSSIVERASTAAGALGVLGVVSGKKNTAITGLKVMKTANSLDAAAGVTNTLAGHTGMDVIFKGGHSPYVVKKNSMRDICIIAKLGDTSVHPMDYYRIVKLNASKKERRIQICEIETSLLGSSKEQGYLPFEAHRESKTACMITIQGEDVEPGEYAILEFGGSLGTAGFFPVATFSVQ